MRGWLRRGAAAAQLAGDRADLWPAGALSWLVYVGWIPLLVVLAQPDPNDLAFLGVTIYTSSALGLIVVGSAVGVVALFALLSGLAAAAEVALLRSAAHDRPSAGSYGRGVLTAFAITLLSSLPAAAATSALLLGVVAVAPGAFQSPDLDTPVLLRIAGALLPLLVALLAALLLGQAFGGLAIRAAESAPNRTVIAALRWAAGSLRRRPGSGIGVAAAGMLVDALVALFTFALLRVLWAPIAVALGDGQLATPGTVLLLLGFVAIWLALLLVAGALHVAVSAWWAMELARGTRGEAH